MADKRISSVLQGRVPRQAVWRFIVRMPRLLWLASAMSALAIAARAQTASLSASSDELAYRAELAKNPDSIAVLTRLANVLGSEHQSKASIYYWRKAAALRPDDQGLLQSLGLELLNDGDNEEAAQLFRLLVTQNPENESAYVNLGAALSRQEKLTDAIGAYRKALLLEPNDAVATLSLIKALAVLQRIEEAKPYIDSYARAYPDDFYSHYFLGLAYRSSGQYRQAIDELRKAESLNDKDYDACVKLGATLLQQDAAEESIPYLKRAISLKPDMTEAHFQLARAYHAVRQAESENQEESTLQKLESAEETDRQAVSLGDHAAEAFREGNFEKAAKLYIQVTEAYPDHTHAYYDVAITYDKLGNFASELAALQEALRRNPQSCESWSQLGILDMKEGRADTARPNLERALQCNPQSPEALSNLGVLEAQSGKLAEAERLLRLAVESNPDFANGYRNLGLVLAAEGAFTDAIAEVQQSLKLQPQDSATWIALGRIYRQAGDLPNAERAFQQALAYSPAVAEAHAGLEDISGKQR